MPYRAYKYKLRPSKRIAQRFEQTLDVCRELYNAALQERRDAYRICKENITYFAQSAQLPEIKSVRDDIAEVQAQVLQNTLRRLSRTFDSFFRRFKHGEKVGYPRFKSRSRYNSFCYPQSKHSFRLNGDKLHLSKIGSVRLRLSRPVEGTIKTCTIKRQADGWYVLFTVESNQSCYFPRTGESVGIDVGIEHFATLSTGETVENPRYLHKAERKLKTAQRSVSRKRRGSFNRRKAVVLLAKRHLKIKRQRLDFFYKLSLELVRRFDSITFEDLNIVGMVKNHRLAKAISDAAWGTFIFIHEGKAESAGRRVTKVSAAFTSQDCSACGNRARKSLAMREHACIACGLVLHRDHNAAINISARASRVWITDSR